VTVALGFEHQRQQHIAGLRDEPDIARLDVVQRQEVDFLVQVEHPRGVRANDPHAALMRGSEHFLLQPDAFRAPGFAETAGQNHRPLDALLAAFDEQTRHAGGRRADQRQVGRSRNVGQRRIRPDAENPIHLGIDRVNPARVTILDQPDHGLVATLGGIGRGTDDGDRIGGEKIMQRAALRCSTHGGHLSTP
jgi:hypothetical protein